MRKLIISVSLNFQQVFFSYFLVTERENRSLFKLRYAGRHFPAVRPEKSSGGRISG